jgi:hypothetical protein
MNGRGAFVPSASARTASTSAPRRRSRRRSSVETGIRFTTEDAEADHADLRARGADADPEVMHMGGGVPPMFSLRDPDGNTLLIVERA